MTYSSKGTAIDKNFLFRGCEHINNNFEFQEDFDHKIWSALPIIVRVMYRVGGLFDKSAHLLVDLPATKAILNGIQADLSFTPQISSADSSNSQSVMHQCIRPRSIHAPDGDDHYASKSCIHARKAGLLRKQNIFRKYAKTG
ncbi:MAG: hypothetical protein V1728_05360 [Candidatus Micrarchaeota archaeon]